PDGARVAVASSPGPSYFQSDVWIYGSSTRERKTRLTFSGANTPAWSSDGATLYFSSDAGGERRIVAKRADGSGGEELVYAPPNGALYVDDVSRREPLLAFEGPTKDGIYKLWLLPLQGERVARPFQQTAVGSQAHARFSPDGRLIAYTSDESGMGQI